jgi:uncharacterized protein YgiM (DUF1202 family)
MIALDRRWAFRLKGDGPFFSAAEVSPMRSLASHPMATRHEITGLVLVCLLVGLPGALPATESPQPPYMAQITAEDVYVRSGPGQNYYPTDKLGHGAKVEVYRHDPGGWCAVRPPEGSFAWVSHRYLSPGQDGLAVVNAEDVAARVGSRFSDIRDVIQVRLKKGEVVEVLGAETDEKGEKRWYKIAPPSGEFRWVSGRYLQPTNGADAAALAETDAASTADVAPSGAADALLEGIRPLNDATDATAPADVPGNYASAESRKLSPEEYDEALKQLDLALSAMVAEEPTVWSFDRLRRQADNLAQQARTAVERGQTRVLLNKIARFAQLERKYERLAGLKQGSERLQGEWAREDSLMPGAGNLAARPYPSGAAAGGLGAVSPPAAGNAPADESGEHRFDGIGRLSQVATTKLGAPRYVLLDNQGRPNCYITPAPGVNLRHYVGQRVGVNGTSGYIPEQRARHVTASHVQPLQTRLR